jgi:hypothetical protein
LGRKPDLTERGSFCNLVTTAEDAVGSSSVIFERNFNLNIDESTARSRLTTYFAQAGYKLAKEEGGSYRYQRGSGRGSWFPLNPAEIKTEALARLSADERGHARVKVEFDVEIKFKDETNFTEEFWLNELNEAGLALSEGAYAPLKSKHLTLRAAWALVSSLTGAVVFILIWGLISFGLAFLILHLTGYYQAGSTTDPYLVILAVMVIVGVGTLLFYRRWTRRRAETARARRKKSG